MGASNGFADLRATYPRLLGCNKTGKIVKPSLLGYVEGL